MTKFLITTIYVLLIALAALVWDHIPRWFSWILIIFGLLHLLAGLLCFLAVMFIRRLWIRTYGNSASK